MNTYKVSCYAVICIVVSLLVGCSGSNDELTRSKAAALIESSALLANGQANGSAIPKPINACLAEAHLTEKGYYRVTDMGKKAGFSYLGSATDYPRILGFSAPKNSSVSVEVTGIKTVEDGSAIVNFQRTYSEPTVNAAFDCIAPNGNIAKMSLYDDGWRVESITLTGYR